MSFADELKKKAKIDYEALEREKKLQEEKKRREKDEFELEEHIRKALERAVEQNGLKGQFIQGVFYIGYVYRDCKVIKFMPTNKNQLLSGKSGDIADYDYKHMLNGSFGLLPKIYSKELNIFTDKTGNYIYPCIRDENSTPLNIKKTLEKLGFKNVSFEMVPATYYYEDLNKLLFKNRKGTINVYYFSFSC